MNKKLAVISYYVVIIFAYFWSAVQIIAGEPFDALVLFIVTELLRIYRNQARRLEYETIN